MMNTTEGTAAERARAMLPEAQDPTTPPQRLGQIAQYAARELGFLCPVVEATAANPNSSPGLLLYLLAIHPHVVMHNPALLLVMVEDPAYLTRAHSFSLLAILSRSDTPPYLVHWLTTHPEPEVATAARLHIHTPDPGGGTWLQELRAYLREASRRRTLHGSELVRLGLTPASLPADRKALLNGPRSRKAQPPRSPVAVPGPGSGDGEGKSRSERLRAARQSAQPEVLARLAEDRRIDVRAAVAGNPAASPETRARLAQDPSAEVRRRVYQSPFTGEAILRGALAAGDGLSESLAQAILENPNTPGELIAALAGHPACRCTSGHSYAFRLGAARHANTPPEILLDLAGDPDVEVRYCLGSHPRFPAVGLSRLRESALRSAVRSESPADRAVAQVHPELPREILEFTAKANGWFDRATVVFNPALEEPILRLLSEDGNRVVRAAARARLAGEPMPDLWRRR